MSTVVVQPQSNLSVTVEQSSPAVVTIENNIVTPISVYNSGTFTGPAFFNGISQVVPTANQISASTVSGITTLSIPSSFITPADARVLGDFRVDGVSTINGDMTVAAGSVFTADVGGDIQGTLPNPTVHRIKNIDIHNNPSDGDVFQYLSSNNKYHWVSLSTAGIAPTVHTHAASDVTSGTFNIARIPTGTSASTVALGSHTHAAADITSGILNIARIPTGILGTEVALGNHTHDAAAIVSGTFPVARIPTGTSGTTVSLGNHTHDASVITSGTIGIGYLPTGTLGTQVALGNHTHDGSAITTGTIAVGRLPTGTTVSTVALGNHTHDGSAITTGTIDGARLGTHTHSIDDISDFKESKVYVETDCNSAGEFTTIALNSPSNLFTSTSLDVVGRYGILNSGTGSSTNAVGGIGSAQESDMIAFGSHKHSTTAMIYIPTLSSATDRFIVEHGFSDLRAGTPTDGAFIQYSDNVNSGKFYGLIYNNNIVYSYDLGITVAAATWYKLRTVVNADRSVQFYVNGNLQATSGAGEAPLGTTSTARRCGLHCIIRKTAGTNTRNLYTDYLNLQIDTAR